MCKLGVISQDGISYYCVLLGSRKSHVPRQLAQQRMTDDLERPFHASHTISVVAELLV